MTTRKSLKPIRSGKKELIVGFVGLITGISLTLFSNYYDGLKKKQENERIDVYVVSLDVLTGNQMDEHKHLQSIIINTLKDLASLPASTQKFEDAKREQVIKLAQNEIIDGIKFLIEGPNYVKKIVITNKTESIVKDIRLNLRN